ncbi:MAG: o-succinylbenzoate synthase [Acidobacteriota bacterium]
MKIELNIFSFDLFFKEPFNTGAGIVDKKEGFLVKIKGPSGVTGFGEASLLPGFTRGSKKEITGQLIKLKNEFSDDHLKNIKDSGNFDTSGILKGEKLFPSVNFALDSAIIDLLRNIDGSGVQRILGTGVKEKGSVRVNALLKIGKDPDETLNEAVRLRSAGFNKIKLKVGRFDPSYEKKVIKELSAIFEGEKNLRFDANCGFDIREAIDFFCDLDPENIEYIEDPFPDPEMIPKFFSETGVPVAPDSLLLKISLKEIETLHGIGALIIKPSVIGGVDRITEFYNISRKLKIPMVFTSLFESGIGLTNIARISSVLDLYETFMGLDTLKFLKEDLLLHSPEIRGGKFLLNSSFKLENGLNKAIVKKII